MKRWEMLKRMADRMIQLIEVMWLGILIFAFMMVYRDWNLYITDLKTKTDAENKLIAALMQILVPLIANFFGFYLVFCIASFGILCAGLGITQKRPQLLFTWVLLHTICTSQMCYLFWTNWTYFHSDKVPAKFATEMYTIAFLFILSKFVAAVIIVYSACDGNKQKFGQEFARSATASGDTKAAGLV